MADNGLKGKDKLYHFSVCFVIALYSTEAAFAAALAKEYGDSKAYGNFWSWWDIVADTLGIILGTVIRVLIIKRWNWL
jgi:uncharacterized membrane protein